MSPFVDNIRGKITSSAAPATAAGLSGGLLYAITLGGTYVYDDIPFILHDARLHNPITWGRLWIEPYHQGVDILYRPLTQLSFALQYAIHADRVWMFHAVNVILHMAVCALVAEIARRMGGIKVAWVAGLLFAAHPVHVEAVANLVGRSELLCAIGMLGAILLWITPGLSSMRVAGIVACFAVSVLSKEQGLVLPVVLLALWPYRRWGSCGDGGRWPYPLDEPPPSGRVPIRMRQGRDGVPALLGEPAPSSQDPIRMRPGRDGLPAPLGEPALWGRVPHRMRQGRERSLAQLAIAVVLLGAAGYVAWREGHPPIRLSWDSSELTVWTNATVESTGLARWKIVADIAGRYVRLLVWPSELRLDYNGSVISSYDPTMNGWAGVGIAAWIVGAVGLARSAWRRKWTVFGLLMGLAATYGVVSNAAVPIGTTMAERLMYLPSAFLLILIGWTVRRMPARWGVVPLTVLVVLGGYKTISYAHLWNNPEALARDFSAREPGSGRGATLLAQELLRQGRPDEADAVLTAAMASHPEDMELSIRHARTAAGAGRFDAALAILDRAQTVEIARQKRLGLDRLRNLQTLQDLRALIGDARAADRSH